MLSTEAKEQLDWDTPLAEILDCNLMAEESWRTKHSQHPIPGIERPWTRKQIYKASHGLANTDDFWIPEF